MSCETMEPPILIAEEQPKPCVEKEKEKEKNKKKIKCFHCKARVPMINYHCKCAHVFCIKHLNAHSHNCTFDYKKERKEQIEKNNPKLGQKLDKI